MDSKQPRKPQIFEPFEIYYQYSTLDHVVTVIGAFHLLNNCDQPCEKHMAKHVITTILVNADVTYSLNFSFTNNTKDT